MPSVSRVTNPEIQNSFKVFMEGLRAKGFSLTLQELDELAIRDALEASKGNITRAAKRIMIGKTTFYRRIHQYGIREWAATPETPPTAPSVTTS